jgi:hypothetical protein
MTEPTEDAGGPGAQTTPGGAAEVARIQAERDALERRVQSLEDRPSKRRRLRRVSTALLLVLTVLLFAVAVPGLWMRRTLGDTDGYVAMVGPLARAVEVQEYLARTVTAQVFEAIGVEDRLNSALADRDPRLAFLAGPITNAVRGFVEEKVRAILASDAFATYWVEANRFVHDQLIAALNGEGDTLAVAGGKVSLNLLPLVNQGLQAVSGVASELVGRPIDLPQLTGEEVPAEAVAKIEQTLGVDLPDRFGTITVYDSQELAAVQDAVNAARRLLVVIVVVFLLAAVGALWVSPRRRRTLIQLMAALAAVLVIERRFAIAAADRVIDRARPENRDAATSVVDQVLGTLLRFTGWLLVAAIVAILVALLSGPYPWAVRMRGWVREVGAAAIAPASRAELGPAAIWMGAHRDLLMLGGGAVFVIALLLIDTSMGWLLLLAAILLVYEVTVYRLSTTTTPA